MKRATVTIDIDAKVKANLPAFRPNITVAKVGQRDGELGLMFQEFNGENPDQATFDHADKKES